MARAIYIGTDKNDLRRIFEALPELQHLVCIDGVIHHDLTFVNELTEYANQTGLSLFKKHTFQYQNPRKYCLWCGMGKVDSIKPEMIYYRNNVSLQELTYYINHPFPYYISRQLIDDIRRATILILGKNIPHENILNIFTVKPNMYIINDAIFNNDNSFTKVVDENRNNIGNITYIESNKSRTRCNSLEHAKKYVKSLGTEEQNIQGEQISDL
jgi:hypothetical protein